MTETRKTTLLNQCDQLLEAAQKAGADQADVVMYDSMDLSVTCRLGKQEELERSESTAAGLRVWVEKKQAITSASDLSEQSILELAERSVAMAKVATDDPYSDLAQEDLWARETPDLDLYDANEVSENTLLEMALAAEQAAMDVRGITNSEGADAYYGTHAVAFAHSGGFAASYMVSSSSLSASVIAGEGVDMQTDYAYASKRHMADLPSPESIGQEAGERAVRRLHPKKMNTGSIPLIFEPRIGKGLLSTFGGAISGSSVARGTTFLKEKLGEIIFSPTITIIDDPLIVRGQGSHPFDGEGVAVKKRTIIDSGTLTTWLLDIRSAAQLGMKTTGHASRGLASPPSPAYSNFYMQPGTASPETLRSDIEYGLYVTEVFGMGVNTVTGDFSQGAGGFLIENGEITTPVSEITIAGHMLEMYQNITPANDLEFRYSANVPTLRIDGMMVAGE